MHPPIGVDCAGFHGAAADDTPNGPIHRRGLVATVITSLRPTSGAVGASDQVSLKGMAMDREQTDQKQHQGESRQQRGMETGGELNTGAGVDTGGADAGLGQDTGQGLPTDVSEMTTDHGMAPGTGVPGGTREQ